MHQLLLTALAQEPIFPDKSDHISAAFDYLQDPSWASRYIADRYPEHWELLSGAAHFEQDVRRLL
jgi:hypothetical protein